MEKEEPVIEVKPVPPPVKTKKVITRAPRTVAPAVTSASPFKKGIVGTVDGRRRTCPTCNRPNVFMTTIEYCSRCYSRTRRGNDPLTDLPADNISKPWEAGKRRKPGSLQENPGSLDDGQKVPELESVKGPGVEVLGEIKTLVDLNNTLFAAMDRLTDKDTVGDKLKTEIERARAVSGLAGQIICNARLALDAQKALGEKLIQQTPKMLGVSG